jgi:hypothetical protein
MTDQDDKLKDITPNIPKDIKPQKLPQSEEPEILIPLGNKITESLKIITEKRNQ